MTSPFRALAIAGALLGPVAAAAQSGATIRAGALTISGAEVVAATAAAPTAAAYLTIANAGATADRLVAVETPAARRAELHETVVTDGVARMVALGDGVEAPAGGAATLAPRGAHVMLMGLAAPLEDGGTLPLTLVFETAGRVEIAAEVHVGAPMRGMEHGMGHGG
ncbi:copper chaperone PCu(A)C [Amaricoccus sp.]|uniref:copper chaperone PCu(A)C n=1 Tax=Amaricoccus sp. TaxID=1872485 RepID=UPI001B771AB3|nr:copper chaperone PCu(A)C [Amaricoccus sp.]MBP7000914.1 copper chaperone PCu(A)C [Amaricoccus sp.]